MCHVHRVTSIVHTHMESTLDEMTILIFKLWHCWNKPVFKFGQILIGSDKKTDRQSYDFTPNNIVYMICMKFRIIILIIIINSLGQILLSYMRAYFAGVERWRILTRRILYSPIYYLYHII